MVKECNRLVTQTKTAESLERGLESFKNEALR
jgi:hypothetical protein